MRAATKSSAALSLLLVNATLPILERSLGHSVGHAEVTLLHSSGPDAVQSLLTLSAVCRFMKNSVLD